MKKLFCAILFFCAAAYAEDHAAVPEAKDGCDRYQRELKVWGEGAKALRAAADPQRAPEVPVGQRADLQLRAAGVMLLSPVPDRQKKRFSGNHAGFAAVRVREAGVYHISAGARAWLDVLDESRNRVESQGHGMLAKCGKIFKLVDFPLEAGKTYTLQIAGTDADMIPILITRAP